MPLAFSLNILSHIKRSISTFCLAIVTISASLFALTFILALLFNFYKVTAAITQNSVTIAFLSVATESQAKAVRNKINQISPQIQVTLVSPKDALAKARNNLGKSYEAILDRGNLTMPWVLKINIKTNDNNSKKIIYTQLKNIAEIEELVLPSKAIERSQWMVRFLFGAGILLSLLLAILVIVIIMNAIRLSIIKHSDEIQVMRLVGATESFIRAPYIGEGFLLGCFGSIISFVATVAFSNACEFFIDDITRTDLQVMGIYIIPYWIFGLVFIFACSLGIASSLRLTYE